MGVLSQRIQKVKPSPTLAVTAKAKELRAQGRDVIGLGAGEPDFDTPEHIKEAAIQAIREGFTKYTAVPGIIELRQAVVNRLRIDSGLEYSADQVVITVGGKQAFYNLAQAIIDPGHEVIIPAPYWVSYPDMVVLAEGTPVIVNAPESNGFRLSPEALEAAITPNTRFVIINSPSNPTGGTYTRQDLVALGEVLKKYPHVWVVTDDIYGKIVFDGFEFVTFAAAVPELKDRTVILDGVSKAYSMTGWRIGWAVGPVNVIKGMSKIQSQSTSNAASMAQRAALAALEGPQDVIAPMVAAFLERRNYVVKRLNAMPGVSCRIPEGAFYVYANVGGLMGKKTASGTLIENSLQLADQLLEHQNVAVVPGSAFGLDPYIRLSFATSMANLEKGMDRIEAMARQLTGA
jgi:aspartate aminotransferase